MTSTEPTEHCNVKAVIPAAGHGSRMQSDIPKQFLTVGGKTLLQYSIEAVCADPRVTEVIVAVSDPDSSDLPNASEFHVAQPVTYISGGDTRAESVCRGVEYAVAQGATHALVHDAARPCLPKEALVRVIDSGTASQQGAILAIPVRDSLKRAMTSSGMAAHIEESVDREHLWQAQTPQVFQAQALLNGIKHMGAHNPQLTDEASAMQWLGYQPVLVEGAFKNVKVTHPEDFECVASWLLASTTTE